MSKTPKGRRLAAALRHARESRGLTLRELGDLTGRNSGVLSRYETADRTPKPEDVAQFLTAMEVRGSEYDEILSLAYDVDASGWVALTLPDRRQQLTAMLEAEQDASIIEHVSHSMFPGMLQVKSYSSAIMVGARVPANQITTRVSTRMGRRDALEKPNPVEFISYVGESALYWMIGGRDAMVDQLRHVLRVGEWPNVHVHIVPFSSGCQACLNGTFMVLDRSVVHVDTGESGMFLHNSADVRSYIDSVRTVSEVACGEAESKAALASRLRELERTA
jgi:transcriptional regulator with XRE-family HTH domain